MKQVAQNYRSGELAVIDVPAPIVRPRRGARAVALLADLDRHRADEGRRVQDVAGRQGAGPARPGEEGARHGPAAGPLTTYKKAMNRLDSYTPLGYSLAGVVVEVGRGPRSSPSARSWPAPATSSPSTPSSIGCRPISVWRCPTACRPSCAAFATVGAIALQGVRQGDVQIGDTACVIGLGLVGQLVVQLLVASGVQVVGLDVVAERCRLAEKAGALLCAAPDDEGLAAVENALAGGLGWTRRRPGVPRRRRVLQRNRPRSPPAWRATGPRSSTSESASSICRGTPTTRRSSTSGSPVRTAPDATTPRYEVEGVDYPAGYVRWTERRNLACFVDLIARGEIDLEPLVSGIFPLDDAVDVYERLSAGALPGVGFLFEYPGRPRLLRCRAGSIDRTSPGAGSSQGGARAPPRHAPAW